MKKILVFMLSLMIITFTACTEESSPDSSSSDSAPSSSSEESVMAEAVLYIGMGINFTEYRVDVKDPTDVSELIAEMSELTGWDLTLTEAPTSGKGGVSILFSEESALFTGPPSEQKEQFHVYDSEQLIMTILDSVQKTVQMNLVDENLALPEELGIYFSLDASTPLYFPEINLEIPLTEPYINSEYSQYQSISDTVFYISFLGFFFDEEIAKADEIVADTVSTEDLLYLANDGGEHYLIVPANPNTYVEVYTAALDEQGNLNKVDLIHVSDDMGPLHIKCNASDIVSNIILVFGEGEDQFEYSPFISLKDGSLVVGEHGEEVLIAGVQ